MEKYNTDRVRQIATAISDEEYAQGRFGEDGITSKNLYRWAGEKQLLRERKAEAKQLKLAFLDYAWIKLLLFMTDLGVSKKSNAKRTRQEQDKISKIIQCLANRASSELLPGLPVQKTKVAKPEIQKKVKASNALLHVLVDSCLNSASYYIRIYKEGHCQLLRNGVVEATSDTTLVVASSSFVQLAIQDILIDFVASQISIGDGKGLMWRGLLTQSEGALIEHMRYTGLVEKITIEVSGQDSERFAVNDGVSKEVALTLARHLVTRDYHQISYVFGGTTSTFLSKNVEG